MSSDGGAPFGGPHDANIRQVCEGYQAVVAYLRAALEAGEVDDRKSE
jgi:hypothetical protein